MSEHPIRLETKVGVFQVAILILSLILLGALAADVLFDLPREVHQIIQVADTAICLLLLADFLVRLSRAESKWSFMKWGWIDLLASIPNLDILRWGRLVRVLRVIQLLRSIRSVHRISTLLFQDRLQGGAVSLALMAFLLLSFSSVAILVCERDEGANIKSAEDAVWWSIATMTTVGYGDRFPITTEGRVVGIVLMVGGVGMFAGLSGLVASLFLGGSKPKPVDTKDVLARLVRIEAKLNELDQKQPSPTQRENPG